MAREQTAVRIGERTVKLTNVDKVLYPRSGFRKRDVIDYISRVGDAMLPHLEQRPATLVRFPDGVEAGSFFEKNVSRHAPEWLHTAHLISGARGQGSGVNDHAVFDDLASLVWAANLAALELHVPQWKVTAGNERCNPDLLVFDLDPGEPATIVECSKIAERIRVWLVADGLRPFVKTSGSKGMQVYCAVKVRHWETPSAYAKRIARRLEDETPELAVATMAKSVRHGKVFVDWSQNNPAKTTIAPYSLRGRERPTVSTPITWSEVAECRRPEDLVFTTDSVIQRLETFGDLWARVRDEPGVLPDEQ